VCEDWVHIVFVPRRIFFLSRTSRFSFPNSFPNNKSSRATQKELSRKSLILSSTRHAFEEVASSGLVRTSKTLGARPLAIIHALAHYPLTYAQTRLQTHLTRTITVNNKQVVNVAALELIDLTAMASEPLFLQPCFN
jgi:hypothetical protein